MRLYGWVFDGDAWYRRSGLLLVGIVGSLLIEATLPGWVHTAWAIVCTVVVAALAISAVQNYRHRERPPTV